MSKPVYIIDEKEKAKLEAAHAKVRANATPAQLKMLEQSDREFEAEMAAMDERHAQETKLREWASGICGFNLDMTEIEQLRDMAKTMVPGKMLVFGARRGEVRVYKTVFGTIDSVDNYLRTLERTLIDITNNSQFTPLRFRGLMSLAFKRLKEDLNKWLSTKRSK